MKDAVKSVYFLEGLCCASCADKIERESSKIEGVEEAVVDFVAKKLILSSHVSSVEGIAEKAKQIVAKIEPDVVFTVYSESHTVLEHPHTHLDKRKWFTFAFSVVFFLLALSLEVSLPLQILLYIIAYILAGYTVLKSAFANLFQGRVFDENFLMSLATFGAFAIGEYPEAVGVMLFYQVGEILQDMAVNKSRRAISDLMRIRPDYATIKVGNQMMQVSPESVNVGDIMLIKAGEKVPLDGVIVEGTTVLDTSALTGESMPREATVGDGVYGGFINTKGLILVKATKRYSESTVAKIMDLVQNAAAKKAPTESFITRFSRVYTPIVVFSAVALAIVPPFLLQMGTFSEWFYKALVFLVVSCPCALVVSVPLGYIGGIGGASLMGILVKGGNYLDALSHVDTVVFDKTGTLTLGTFQVSRVESLGHMNQDELLRIAALLESHSNHPIAKSIVKAYGEPLEDGLIEDYTELAGLGVKARYQGRIVSLGNTKLMAVNRLNTTSHKPSETVVYVQVDGQIEGLIYLEDEIKPNAKITIQALFDLGIRRVVLLTGDNKAVAESVARQVGIDELYAELLPHEKVDQLESVVTSKLGKGKTLFIGDGINDAPVLARADVGMAMGGIGSDAAIEAADVVLMTDELTKIPQAIRLAKRTQTIVWQNIIFALGVKAGIMVLGALGIATMWEAVFGDVGVALIAVVNSMRSLRRIE